MKNRKMHTTVGLVCVVLAVVIVTFFSLFPDTLAWFFQAKRSDVLEFKSGKLHYVLEYAPKPILDAEGKPIISKIIVPEEQLLTTLKLTNFSTIDSDLRMKITYTDYNDEADIVEKIKTHEATGSKLTANLDLAAETAEDTGYFIWDGGEFWQYAEKIAINTEQNGTVIPIFLEPLNFCYSGELANNEFNGVPHIRVIDGKSVTEYTAKPVTVTLTFQMKQRQSLGWEDAFVIGISNEVVEGE